MNKLKQIVKKIVSKIEFIILYRIKFLIPMLKSRLFFKPKIKAILFFPQIPSKRTIVYKVCRKLGIEIVYKQNKKYDLSFFWEDRTISKFCTTNIPYKNALNLGCTDITKEHVQNVFEEVFGYSLKINPENFSGECVMKSNENGMHDGKIIKCPIKEKSTSVVYQKVINNYINENHIVDFRVPVVGNKIPLVYFKIKEAEKRFSNDTVSVELHSTDTVFSKEEIENVFKFSSKMNLNYGELDILRDNDNNNIYIVDVNKTPWGPPKKILNQDYPIAIEKLANSFEEMAFESSQVNGKNN